MSFSDWSTTPSANALALGVNIGENCPPSNVNDAIRKVMSDARTAINPVLDDFLASTSLSSARTELGVPTTSASLTAFGALTNAANKLPYMTGSDAWALTDLTSFARTILASGDAGTFVTALGITVTTNSNGSCISIPISGTTYKLQFATGSGQTSEGSQTVTWPVAFTTSCLFASVGTRIASGTSSADSMYQLIGTPSITAATVYLQVLDGNSVSHTPTVIGFGS